VYARPSTKWEGHLEYRCEAGHGARDLETPAGSSYKDDISLAECEAACLTLPGCDGVRYLQASGGTSCYRIADVSLDKCQVGDAHWSTFLRPDSSGFVAHVGYNCSQDHGARDLDAGSRFGNSSITVEECEAGCISTTGCTAIRFLRANGGTSCNRLANVDFAKCLIGDPHWTTYAQSAAVQHILV